MRIRTKIALLYSLAIFLVMAAAFVAVYVRSAKNIHRSFSDELYQRGQVINQFAISRLPQSDPRYNRLRREYLFELPEEQRYVFDADSVGVADTLRRILRSQKYIDRMMNAELVQFRSAGRHYAGFYFPGDDLNRLLLVSARDSRGTADLRAMQGLLTIILLSSTMLVFLLGQLYARRVLAPVRRITDEVKSITAGNLDRSLHSERGNDELAELSRTFNQMIERLRTAFDMQNSFIRNASHELRNPLAAILGQTEFALRRPRTGEEYVASLHTVLEESERLNSMMQDLLMLAQADFDFSRIKKEPIDPTALCRGIVEEVRRSYPDALVEIVADDPDGYAVTGAASILRLALLNLVANAVKFSDGKPVEIRLRKVSGEGVEIEVADRGIGIPADELSRVFQPFYRGGNTSGFKGTGIGLAFSKRMIELHGGQLAIESTVGEGTTVRVRLRAGD